ncbi:MAG: DUF5990 family protein [Acidobacteria bacterium]|nr:DUF5990 family protein [Acidobacteriota bacterium]MCA1608052.1 DUF5990 family protein [Acidobacteriota bacterium]
MKQVSQFIHRGEGAGRRYCLEYIFFQMKYEIPARIIINDPPRDISMQVQQGRDKLLPPSRASKNSLAFDFALRVEITDNVPNFLGEFAQGPKSDRFIYVNSGTMAGQADSCWTRRAKISLMKVTASQVEQLLATDGLILETSFPGTGSDGGPTCASVKGVEWRIVKR